MKGPILQGVLIGLLCLHWLSCANIMTPDGGERDERPPMMRSRTLNDSALNFKGGTLVFEFDEYIKINDLQNQMIVTPLLQSPPRVKVHKRKLSIAIDDSLLQENTTYTLFLGNAIVDLRESNAYPNLGFTFSTGNYFDSLSLRGKLIDAANGMPDTAAYVLLYPAGLPDSAFFLRKPLYMQKTEAGNFHLKNLPSRSFTIYALRDNNKNLRYDLNAERIAFIDKPVQPGDSAMIVLYTFEAKDKRDSSRVLKPKSNVQPIKQAASNKLVYFVNVDTTQRTKRTLGLKDSVVLQFNRELVSMDVTGLRLYQDSVLDASAQVVLDSGRQKVVLQTQWTEDALYRVELKKGFVQDSSGLQSSAAIFYFRTKRKSDYGFLTVRYHGKASDMIELLRGDEVIARKPAIDSLSSFDMLQPDNYRLRIIHDENLNGIWDTGTFFPEKKQPERVELFPGQITIKANWENKIDVDAIYAPKIKLNKP